MKQTYFLLLFLITLFSLPALSIARSPTPDFARQSVPLPRTYRGQKPTPRSIDVNTKSLRGKLAQSQRKFIEHLRQKHQERTAPTEESIDTLLENLPTINEAALRRLERGMRRVRSGK